MKLLLQQYKIEFHDLSVKNEYPILKRHDCSGRPYWVISYPSYLDHNVSASEDLSQLEWDRNEVYLDACSEAEISKILLEALEIMNDWKRQLTHMEPDTPFLILATYDDGVELINKEAHPGGWYSITFRFWAPRGANTVLNLEDFEDWEQPAILLAVNEASF